MLLYVIGCIGSTALYLSRQLIAGNLARCALALGFEKMQVYVSHPIVHIFVHLRKEHWGWMDRVMSIHWTNT